MRHGKSHPNLKLAQGIFRTANQSVSFRKREPERDVAAPRANGKKLVGRTCILLRPTNPANNDTNNSLAPLVSR